MKELIIATKNKGKLKEIKELLSDFNLNITSLADYPHVPEIIENGKTFRENALIKAETIARYTGKMTLGEDSGIEIKALNNAPGIYSARFSGKNANDQKNNRKMLKELGNVKDKDRGARYRCSAVLIDGRKNIEHVQGSCSGFITRKARGKNGFGYDPYFLIKRYDKTFGELDPSIKAKISHRARALKKLRKLILRKYPQLKKKNSPR